MDILKITEEEFKNFLTDLLRVGRDRCDLDTVTVGYKVERQRNAEGMMTRNKEEPAQGKKEPATSLCWERRSVGRKQR